MRSDFHNKGNKESLNLLFAINIKALSQVNNQEIESNIIMKSFQTRHLFGKLLPSRTCTQFGWLLTEFVISQGSCWIQCRNGTVKRADNVQNRFGNAVGDLTFVSSIVVRRGEKREKRKRNDGYERAEDV